MAEKIWFSLKNVLPPNIESDKLLASLKFFIMFSLSLLALYWPSMQAIAMAKKISVKLHHN